MHDLGSTKDLVMPLPDKLIDELESDEAVKLALQPREYEAARASGVLTSLPAREASPSNRRAAELRRSRLGLGVRARHTSGPGLCVAARPGAERSPRRRACAPYCDVDSAMDPESIAVVDGNSGSRPVWAPTPPPHHGVRERGRGPNRKEGWWWTGDVDSEGGLGPESRDRRRNENGNGGACVGGWGVEWWWSAVWVARRSAVAERCGESDAAACTAWRRAWRSVSRRA
jgi:hypothetical protein